jgi:hypothetical protein
MLPAGPRHPPLALAGFRLKTNRCFFIGQESLHGSSQSGVWGTPGVCRGKILFFIIIVCFLKTSFSLEGMVDFSRSFI